jgi:hypothetical protein
MKTYLARFAIGVRVSIDDDPSLIGVVTAYQFRAIPASGGGIGSTYAGSCEVSYVYNGDAKMAWIEEWRLKEYER